jgi:hypothetical protein
MANQDHGDYWDDPTDDSTGLLGHFIGRIDESFWSNLGAETQGKVSGEGADNTKLFWHLEVLDILQEDFGGTPPETITVNYGIGGKWWVDPDNAHLVEHEDEAPDNPKPLKFHGNSALGKLLSAVAFKDEPLGEYKVLDGAGDVDIVMKGVADYFRKNGFRDARDARIWKGLIFEFRGLGFPYGKGKFGNMKPFPTRFAGMDADGLDVTPKDEGVPMEDSVWLGLTSAATAKMLDKLVTSSSSHEDFVKNASMLPDVKGNDDLLAAIADPNNYDA